MVVEATGGGRVRADDGGGASDEGGTVTLDDGGGLGAEVRVEASISDPRVVPGDEEEEDLK